jgi:hypothetical protein
VPPSTGTAPSKSCTVVRSVVPNYAISMGETIIVSLEASLDTLAGRTPYLGVLMLGRETDAAHLARRMVARVEIVHV